MNLATLRKLIFEKNLPAMLRLGGQANHLYRSAFATSAGANGVLALLAREPSGVEAIARHMALGPGQLPAVEAWLECGVKAGEIARRDGRYRLRGRLSRMLAQSGNATLGALFEEVSRYHYDAILQAPQRLRESRPYTLADQDGDLIARASRILEPLVEEAIDWAFETMPATNASVLEIGCGAGHYVGYMLSRQPALRVVALDYQAEVADAARRNLTASGYRGADLHIEHADILGFETSERFDLITLHNNIYYFSGERRAALLRKVRALLRPQGRLLLTTSCRGGSAAIAALHLWWALSETEDGLPQRETLTRLLREHGFANVQDRRVLPGESYYAFLASVA
ncbi:class I SAM-dependent methyltransferase [Ralstonia sp. R-29]|uniref:class I SAM-dependent methyltransferase n=1 Tax=Ralstonia sp. R-29 TaxID=3404059 RepID=UPI003CF30921